MCLDARTNTQTKHTHTHKHTILSLPLYVYEHDAHSTNTIEFTFYTHTHTQTNKQTNKPFWVSLPFWATSPASSGEKISAVYLGKMKENIIDSKPTDPSLVPPCPGRYRAHSWQITGQTYIGRMGGGGGWGVAMARSCWSRSLAFTSCYITRNQLAARHQTLKAKHLLGRQLEWLI